MTGPTWRRRPPDAALVGAVLVAAFVIRAGVVLATRHDYHVFNDPADYMRTARSLAAGHGFPPSNQPYMHGPSAYRTPLLPMMLGALFVVTGASVTAARLFIAIWGTAFAASLGALGWRLGGRRVGLLALVAGAGYPGFVLAGYGLQYEVIYLALTTTAVVAVLQWRETPERRWLLPAAGALVGLAMLCREQAGFLLIPLGIMAWRSRPPTRPPKPGRLAAILLPVVVVVAPWTVRNAMELHAFVPVSDSLFPTLAGAYNATTIADTRNFHIWIPPYRDPRVRRQMVALGPAATEPQADAAYRKAAFDFMASHPLDVARTMVWNTVKLFDLRGFGDAYLAGSFIPWDLRLTKISVIAWWIVAPVALGGLATARGRRIPPELWIYPVVLYLLLAPTVSDIQYRVYFEPLVLVLAAMAVLAVWERYFSKTA